MRPGLPDGEGWASWSRRFRAPAMTRPAPAQPYPHTDITRIPGVELGRYFPGDVIHELYYGVRSFGDVDLPCRAPVCGLVGLYQRWHRYFPPTTPVTCLGCIARQGLTDAQLDALYHREH